MLRPWSDSAMLSGASVPPPVEWNVMILVVPSGLTTVTST